MKDSRKNSNAWLTGAPTRRSEVHLTHHGVLSARSQDLVEYIFLLSFLSKETDEEAEMAV